MLRSSSNSCLFDLGALVAFVTALSVSLPAWSKGWSSTGGGTGLLCPKTFPSSNENSLLRLELEIFDLAEATTTEKNLIFQLQKARNQINVETLDWLRIYNSVLKDIARIDQRFAEVLLTLSNELDPDGWEKNSQLTFEDDLGVTLHSPHECRQVQIMRRITFNTSSGLSLSQLSKTSLPKTQIIYNPDLWSLLDPIQKAMLVLHENLYVIDQSLGIHDSRRTRKLVREFFLLRSFGEAERSSLRQRLHKYFEHLTD